MKSVFCATVLTGRLHATQTSTAQTLNTGVALIRPPPPPLPHRVPAATAPWGHQGSSRHDGQSVNARPNMPCYGKWRLDFEYSPNIEAFVVRTCLLHTTRTSMFGGYLRQDLVRNWQPHLCHVIRQQPLLHGSHQLALHCILHTGSDRCGQCVMRLCIVPGRLLCWCWHVQRSGGFCDGRLDPQPGKWGGG